MHHLAGLARQGLAGHGAIGRVQVALAQRVVVGSGRAGARRDRDIRARPLIAAQRRADADDAGAVFLHQIAPGHHVQQAGARHLDVGIPDVAACMQQRDIRRAVVQEHAAQAGDVAPRQRLDRRRRAQPVEDAAVGLRQVLHGHARAEPDQVALHRIEADRFRSFRARGSGARRVRPESEQRMRVLVGATGPSARGTGEPSMLLLCDPRCRPPARS